MIRLLIADDHAIVRVGLGRVFAAADDIELVAAAADGAEAVALCTQHHPDVVLLDLVMPRMDGIQATAAILAARPTTRVVVLTSFSDRDRIMRALDAGAVGYLLKDAEPAELLAGIRSAARGASPLAPEAASVLLQVRHESRTERVLSDREREVLRLVASGLPNKLVARRLGITEKTVKAHLTSIYRQIGVFDRINAALWAREHGLLDP
jgi:DNA-binding NarL/FixJ family response regulator